MKNTLKLIIAASVLGLSSVAQATILPSSGTVSIVGTNYDGVTNIGGGEFEAKIAGFGTFYTFCMEHEESIGLPGVYDYKLSSSVDSHPDNVSKGTAYLYELFVKGDLYARTLNAAHDLNAGYLQAAIWLLEDEVTYGFTYTVGNPYLQMVASKFGSLAAGRVDDNMGRVQVLNLTLDGVRQQDVLVYVPDSGTTLALFGLGLSCLALIGRKRYSAV